MVKAVRRILAHSLLQPIKVSQKHLLYFFGSLLRAVVSPLLRVQTNAWEDDVILGMFSDLGFSVAALQCLCNEMNTLKM